MRLHSLVKQDDVIYWQKIAVDDEGDAEFAAPVIIKCRWDMVSVDKQTEDVLTMEIPSNSVFPDRVLTIGSYLMLGGKDDLDNFSAEQRENPKLLRDAREVQSQQTITELGWPQQNVVPGMSSEHMVIECRV